MNVSHEPVHPDHYAVERDLEYFLISVDGVDYWRSFGSGRVWAYFGRANQELGHAVIYHPEHGMTWGYEVCPAINAIPQETRIFVQSLISLTQ